MFKPEFGPPEKKPPAAKRPLTGEDKDLVEKALGTFTALLVEILVPAAVVVKTKPKWLHKYEAQPGA